jgi:CheY-like chemotaxis protein
MAEQRTLLLVDDERNVLLSLNRLFSRRGYSVLMANSGVEGLALLEQHDIGVILSDQRMPGMTGVEFLSEVKQRHPDIVRLMLSGFADLKAVTAAINEGDIYRFLTKPCDNDLLSSNMEEAFQYYEFKRENEYLRRELQSSNRALEDAFRAAERQAQARSEFLAQMSYEIRTPLNGMLGMLELFQDVQLQPEQQERLELITSSSNQLQMLINDTLDETKTEAGEQTLENIDFNLLDLVKDTTKLLSVQARDKGLELVTQLGLQSPVIVRGAPTRLRQVLISLIGNAISSASEGKVVLRVSPLEADADVSHLLFEIDDKVVDVEKMTQHNLADSFVPAENTTTSLYEDNGRGVGICKSLVAAMDGEIGFSSDSDQGVACWFTVQFARIESPSDMQTALANSQKRILVVENNPINQAVARGLLCAYGLNVEIVNNGQEAVEAVSRNHYDLIFMDCRMPVMDGYEATRKIRENETARHQDSDEEVRRTPIIAFTANAMRGDRERCLNAGMDDYLVKPIDRELLEIALTRWLMVKDDRELPGLSGPACGSL